ncbi:kinase-like protein [Lentithecium fluviatile CBS 122367]|uniref:mitogen-activated protein kinase n=1 Tax=Lentithecium fluviatile CBS 122367 TaxID=1168545 RepID=A0A6G1ITM6_9PLEO|nr:kinase-like protein [Lentithecium fluviatile CBS 122367]
MTELAELIEDFKLETHFRDDFVYHVYHECDPSAGRRVLKRREYWKRGKHLGSGGFGSVWLEECVDGRQNGQLRAVKDIQCPRGRVDYTRELEALARFSKGSCARWFCQSFGWYEQDDKIHLTMEYFPLGDLQSYIIRSQEPLPEADAQEITLQIIEGLEFMHKRNFAHRDIKPGNILLQSHPPQGWWIKISDFGLSKRLRESLAVSSSVIGTLAFMSPEQQGFVSSNEETLPCPKAADIWAVGAMAHLLLTKRHLFSVPFELYQYISQPNEYLPLRLLREHIPLEASTFIQAAMTVDPQRRLTAEQALKSPWM